MNDLETIAGLARTTLLASARCNKLEQQVADLTVANKALEATVADKETTLTLISNKLSSVPKLLGEGGTILGMLDGLIARERDAFQRGVEQRDTRPKATEPAPGPSWPESAHGIKFPDRQLTREELINFTWFAAREGMVSKEAIQPGFDAAVKRADETAEYAKKLEARVRELEGKGCGCEGTDETIAALASERDQLLAELAAAKSGLDAWHVVFVRFFANENEKTAALSAREEAHRVANRFAEIRSELAAAKSAYQCCSEARDAIRARVQELESDRNALRTELTSVQDELRVCKSVRDTAERRVTALEGELRQRMAQYEAEVGKLQSDLAEYKEAVGASTKRIKALTADLAALRGEEWTEAQCAEKLNAINPPVRFENLSTSEWQRALLRFANACRVRPSVPGPGPEHAAAVHPGAGTEGAIAPPPSELPTEEAAECWKLAAGMEGIQPWGELDTRDQAQVSRVVFVARRGYVPASELERVKAELEKVTADTARNRADLDAARSELTTLRARVVLPLTEEQREELAKVARDALVPERAHWPVDERWPLVVDAIAPRIARVGVRELTDEEVYKAATSLRAESVSPDHLAMGGASPLELMGGPYYRIRGQREFARAVLAVATDGVQKTDAELRAELERVKAELESESRISLERLSWVDAWQQWAKDLVGDGNSEEMRSRLTALLTPASDEVTEEEAAELYAEAFAARSPYPFYALSAENRTEWIRFATLARRGRPRGRKLTDGERSQLARKGYEAYGGATDWADFTESNKRFEQLVAFVESLLAPDEQRVALGRHRFDNSRDVWVAVDGGGLFSDSEIDDAVTAALSAKPGDRFEFDLVARKVGGK